MGEVHYMGDVGLLALLQRKGLSRRMRSGCIAPREMIGRQDWGIGNQNCIFDHLLEFTHIPRIGPAGKKIQGFRA